MTEFAMHVAARNGDLERLRQLIEAGVPVDSLNEEGQTPLHRAACFGKYEVAALLINYKSSTVNLKDKNGYTPLMCAAYSGQKKIVDLLLHRGALQVNCDDSYGPSLLRCASVRGWADIVRLILDTGEADLDAVSKCGETPLMCAARERNEEIAVLLIRAGADVNRSDIHKSTALHWAVEGGSTRVMHTLLEKEGLDLSPQDVNGNTPLHLACQRTYREAIKRLLDAGADTNVRNNDGETPLTEGIRRGNLVHKEIRLFVQKGAFLENCDYERISLDSFLKVSVLKDVELCTQSVVNKFNRQSLSALNSIAHFARRLPNVDNFELGAQQIDEVENLVRCEIEKNTFCNVVKVRPIALSALCVLSLITYQSGKKRSAFPDFGHLPFKKNRN